jgi:hypothetical protein
VGGEDGCGGEDSVGLPLASHKPRGSPKTGHERSLQKRPR